MNSMNSPSGKHPGEIVPRLEDDLLVLLTSNSLSVDCSLHRFASLRTAHDLNQVMTPEAKRDEYEDPE